MSCRVKYAEAIADKIRETVGVDHNTAEEIYPGKILLKVSPENPKLKNKHNVTKWAKRLADKLNTMFNSKDYGTVATIDDRYLKGTIINYNIPTKLVDAYKNKNAYKPVKKAESSSETGLLSEKTLSLSEFPQEIIDTYKGDIRTLLDDDSISLDQFKNFIEHLKNCK